MLFGEGVIPVFRAETLSLRLELVFVFTILVIVDV